MAMLSSKVRDGSRFILADVMIGFQKRLLSMEMKSEVLYTSEERGDRRIGYWSIKRAQHHTNALIFRITMAFHVSLPHDACKSIVLWMERSSSSYGGEGG